MPHSQTSIPHTTVQYSLHICRSTGCHPGTASLNVNNQTQPTPPKLSRIELSCKFVMAEPYKFMGIQVHGPGKYIWDTILYKIFPTTPMPAAGNDDAAIDLLDDDKFAGVQKTILSATSFPAPRFFKATFHCHQLKHGDTTLTLPAKLDDNAPDFSGFHPIPTAVILVSHETLQGRDTLLKDLFMLASNTIHEMKKGNEDHWWAAAVFMMAEYESLDKFPFSGPE
ncbi:beta-hexosaminidase [Apiospora arundinis]